MQKAPLRRGFFFGQFPTGIGFDLKLPRRLLGAGSSGPSPAVMAVSGRDPGTVSAIPMGQALRLNQPGSPARGR
ncbi:hypothetical protein J4G37_10025 [Microvirga sp. 3-52]|nr:hypothetical protein [Microvirga sp. 3-52]